MHPSQRILPIALVVALAALLGACAPGAAIRATPTGEVAPFTFEAVPGQTRIARFDPPGAGSVLELSLAVLARNPNDFGVRLDRFDYRVVLGGLEVASGTLHPNAWVEAGATLPLRFPVVAELPPQRPLLAAVARSFADEPLPFTLAGSAGFSAGGFEFDSRPGTLLEGELRPRETVSRPRMLVDDELSRAYLLRPGVPVIQISAEVFNPGEIGYFLTGKDVLLALNERTVALMDVEPLPVPAGDLARLDLLFYPDPTALEGAAALALDAVLQGVPTRFAVRGGMAMDVLGVESFPVPEGLALDGFVYAD